MEAINQKKVLTAAENNQVLAQAFLNNHISVVQLDLRTGSAQILKSERDQEFEGGSYPWSEVIERYARRRVYPPDREIVCSITLERLRSFDLEEKGGFPLEVRCLSEDRSIQWAEIAVTRVGAKGETLIITTRDIDEAVLMRKIVDLFVFQNYDYLYLIDARKDTYIRFTGNKGNTPVPPERGEHYTEDMIRFNRKYVTPEDCERVTASMQIPHVVRMLENSEIYSFTSGGITTDGRYRRSRLVFLYYDKAAGLILSARTNVTQIYLEERKKNRELAEALSRAQNDALTGIYNQKATAELVTRSLENQYRDMAAILFIDVDNFKMVNDTLGHQKGDVLLCFLAHAIRDIAGRNGIAGRIGGDEFLLYLPAVAAEEDIRRIARRVCGIFEAYADESLNKDSVSCSVGISIYPRDGTDYETLLRKADQALYTSKRYGKNQYSLYSHEIEDLAQHAR